MQVHVSLISEENWLEEDFVIMENGKAINQYVWENCHFGCENILTHDLSANVDAIAYKGQVLISYNGTNSEIKEDSKRTPAYRHQTKACSIEATCSLTQEDAINGSVPMKWNFNIEYTTWCSLNDFRFEFQI